MSNNRAKIERNLVVELYKSLSDFFLAPFLYREAFKKFLEENEEFKKLNETFFQIISHELITQHHIRPSFIFEPTDTQEKTSKKKPNYLPTKLNNFLVEYEAAIQGLEKEPKESTKLLDLLQKHPLLTQFVYEKSEVLQYFAIKFHKDNSHLLANQTFGLFDKREDRVSINKIYFDTIKDVDSIAFSFLAQQVTSSYDKENEVDTSPDDFNILLGMINWDNSLKKSDFTLDPDEFMNHIKNIIKEKLVFLHLNQPGAKRKKLEEGHQIIVLNNTNEKADLIHKKKK